MYGGDGRDEFKGGIHGRRLEVKEGREWAKYIETGRCVKQMETKG